MNHMAIVFVNQGFTLKAPTHSMPCEVKGYLVRPNTHTHTHTHTHTLTNSVPCPPRLFNFWLHPPPGHRSTYDHAGSRNVSARYGVAHCARGRGHGLPAPRGLGRGLCRWFAGRVQQHRPFPIHCGVRRRVDRPGHRRRGGETPRVQPCRRGARDLPGVQRGGSVRRRLARVYGRCGHPGERQPRRGWVRPGLACRRGHKHDAYGFHLL